MNPIIKIMLSVANIPDQAVNDLEKEWPEARDIIQTFKSMKPDLEAATPHVQALEPLIIKNLPNIKRIWPKMLALLPVIDEWADIVSKKTQ